MARIARQARTGSRSPRSTDASRMQGRHGRAPMRLLYLDWPHLPLRLELARRDLHAEIVVLGGHPWEAGTVLDCSPGAGRLGVSRGQALGSAHNLVPDAVFLPADPDSYAADFEGALDRLAQFTPALEGQTD